MSSCSLKKFDPLARPHLCPTEVQLSDVGRVVHEVYQWHKWSVALCGIYESKCSYARVCLIESVNELLDMATLDITVNESDWLQVWGRSTHYDWSHGCHYFLIDSTHAILDWVECFDRLQSCYDLCKLITCHSAVVDKQLWKICVVDKWNCFGQTTALSISQSDFLQY